MYLEKRNIAKSIIFTIITLGLYNIYWFIKLNDELLYLSDEEDGTSGVMAFIFSIITFGIYEVYWSYKSGKRIARAQEKYKMDVTDNSVLYLILSIFGLTLITESIIQSEINNIIDWTRAENFA